MTTQALQQPHSEVPRSSFLEPLVDETEVARLLDQSLSFVRQDRGSQRHGIPYVRVGRSIRYRPADIAAWIEKNTVCDSQASD